MAENSVTGPARLPQGAWTRKATVVVPGKPSSDMSKNLAPRHVPPARPTFTSPGKPGYVGGKSVPPRVQKIVFPNRTAD